MYGELIPKGDTIPIPLLKKRLLIGRNENCDIRIPLPTISGFHCELKVSEGNWFVKDLDSRNGIKVNGVRVTKKRLEPGDMLTVATSDFTLQYHPSAVKGSLSDTIGTIVVSTVICPHCKSRLSHASSLAGRTVKCPKCQEKFKVPSGKEHASKTSGGQPSQKSSIPEAEIVSGEDEATIILMRLGASLKLDKQGLVRSVSFSGPRVNDTSLMHLIGLANLTALNLTDTQISDAGLEHVAALTKLQTLNLSGTKVTDGGLRYLKSLAYLEVLDLSNTRVTDEGTSGLKQSLHDCEIMC